MLPDIKINAFVSVGPYFLEKPYQELDFSKQKVIPRCPDEESAVIMEEYIREIRKQGDTGERLLVLFKMFQLV
jgi:chorismate synthase